MKPQDLAEILSREDFVRELHHLLWIEPQMNGGQRDEGWNCRDHALIVAGVAHLLGFKSALVSGRAGFVQGGSGDLPPIGINMAPHTWVGVEKAGHYDLTVRLHAVSFHQDWRDWGVVGLVADQFAPPGRARVAYVYEANDFENAVNWASNQRDTNVAIYRCEGGASLSAEHVRNALETCNSLLTNWLRVEFGGRQDLHARAIVHLVDLLQGRGKPLAALPRIDAWRDLAQRATLSGGSVAAETYAET